MDPTQATFVITREDEMADPVVLIQQGILLGRLPSCQIVLNHPTVSRVHAGINRVGVDFYLINLSSANPLIINGRLLAAESADVLAAGDLVEIGPFALEIVSVEQKLSVTITQLALAEGVSGSMTGRLSLRELPPKSPSGRVSQPGRARGTGRLSAVDVNNVLKVFWKKRTRDRSERSSPLRPREQPLPGKARINWRPTGDLTKEWPASIFFWSFLVLAIAGLGTFFVYAQAFAPAPLSDPHARATLTRPAASAIAQRPNANSCTTCHRPVEKMETTCSACHQTAAFHADIIDQHRQAGITCTSCHSEHQGATYQPRTAAFASCATCHDDRNHQLYRGQAVHTPHGGTVGYPVKNGEWIWTGLSEAELAVLPEVQAQRDVQDGLTNWRSKQFHALHVYRVRTVPGLRGNDAGQVSCSTCHTSFAPVDRITPGTTCAKCHQQADAGISLGAAPINCTSCHVQHPLDTARWGEQLTDGARQNRTDAILNRIKAGGLK